jgi:hypothetical protein
MTTYIVTEVVTYRVEADSEDAAIEHVTEDGDRDSHCFRAVEDRT